MKYAPVYDRIDSMKYRYTETFVIDLGFTPPNGKDVKTPFGLWSSNGVLTLDRGFCIDGATYALDTPNIIGPAGVHDWGTAAVNREDLPIEYRSIFDKLFKEQCAENGIHDIRVEWLGGAVYIYGKTATPIKLRFKNWLTKLWP